MSFFVRFLWDIYLNPKLVTNLFAYLMVGDMVVVFEGLSFLTLLMFHYINFKQQAPGAVEITTENVQTDQFINEVVNN